MGKRVEVGRSGGKAVHFDLELLLRSRLLIQANSGGGKSWAIRRLAEQLFGKVQVIIIDREGEFPSLCDKYPFLRVGQGGDTPADIRSARLLAERILELRVSTVCDLYEAFRTSTINRLAWVRAFLTGLVDAPKALWHDVVVIVDEAHLFCPQVEPKGQNMQEREIISGCKEAMIALATVGRKRGQCAVWATQRLAKLDKDASAELFNRMVGMTMEDQDVDRAVDLMSVSREDKADFRKSLRNLEPGQFYTFGRAVSKERILVHVGGVETSHQEAGSSKSEYEPPPTPDKILALLPKLADLPKEIDVKEKTEADLRKEVRLLKAQLSAKPPVPAPPPQISKYDEKIVEVPVMGKREVSKLEKLVERVEKAKSNMGFAAQSLEISTRDIVAMIDRMKDGKSTNEIRRSVGLAPVQEKKPAAIELKAVRSHPASNTMKYVEPSGRILDKCERSILGVLAQYPEGCSIGKISLLAGYKQSGSFMSALSSLRTQGYLAGNNSETMRITDPGIDVLGDFRALPAGAALAEYWLRHPSFGACERKILAAVLNSKGGLTIDEICEKTGYSPSGSFMSSLSSLRTAGVLVGKNSEKMSAAEPLYG